MKKKSSQFIKLLNEANKAYPDEYIGHYFNMETGKTKRVSYGGDTLALFIGNEIESLYDSAETMGEYRDRVCQALDNAAGELERVSAAIERGRGAPLK